MSSTIEVKNISADTSEKDVRDFFSFCGKIADLSVSGAGSGSQTATVTFEKETAAKTALLLDNTQLGANPVQVTSANSGSSGEKSGSDNVGSTTGTGTGPVTGAGQTETHGDIAQEDKPRSRIFAEYLAHGYVVGDKAIDQALKLDQQHGISSRFTQYLKQADDKLQATQRAQAVDQKYNITQQALSGWQSIYSYFDKATTNNQTGHKLRSLYEQGSKQVLDVHNEAKHLADLKSGKPAGVFSNVSSSKPTAEEAEMEKVDIAGKERTKCNCGGVDGKCPCEPGKCACSGCSKAS